MTKSDLPKIREFRGNGFGLLAYFEDGNFRRISPWIKVEAVARVPHRDVRRAVLKFKSFSGAIRRLFVQLSELRKPHLLRDMLVDAGFRWPRSPEDERLLLEYLNRDLPTESVELAMRDGWHGADAYVLGAEIYGSRRMLRDPSTYRKLSLPMIKGNLESWQRTVLPLCATSSRLVFGICTAFAAPLLHPSSTRGCIVHISGDRSKGKSTLLCAAASVSRPGVEEIFQNWSLTNAGIEEQAAAGCDSLLIIDSLERMPGDPRTQVRRLREITYMLSDGSGRVRSERYAKDGLTAHWRCITISGGELPGADYYRRAEEVALGGTYDRLIELPVLTGSNKSIYERLPDGTKSDVKALVQLRRACAKNYGSAIRPFLKSMITDGELARKLRRYIALFMKEVGVPLEPFERRYASRFALIEAAGLLAVDYGTLPWSPDLIRTAIRACYRDAHATLPTAAKTTAESARLVKKKLRRAGAVVDARAGKAVPTKQRGHGYLLDSAVYGKFVAVKHRRLRNWLGNEQAVRALAEKLKEDDLLLPGSGGKTFRQVKVRGLPRRRYLCIKRAFFGPGTMVK